MQTKPPNDDPRRTCAQLSWRCGVDDYGHLCGTCSYGQSCNHGFCDPDPSSQWDVTVTSGTVPERAANGSAWDPFGGLPDPFVCLEIGGKRNCTGAVGDTLLPFWNQTVFVATAATLQAGVVAEYWDLDVAFNDPLCARSLFSIRPEDLASGAVRIGCPPNGPTGFEVRFTPHRPW